MGSMVHLQAFADWYLGLSREEQAAVDRYLKLLEENGVVLDHPYASALKSSRHALRELRVKTASVIRIAYAFDPERQAVAIIGAGKRGKNEKRFYAELIREAEKHWEAYLNWLKKKK